VIVIEADEQVSGQFPKRILVLEKETGSWY